MADTAETPPPAATAPAAPAAPIAPAVAPSEPVPSEDDRRAAAAAVNRKRALEEWEANKKRWLAIGVPTGLPAKK